MVLSELNFISGKILKGKKKIKVNNRGEFKPQSSHSDIVMAMDFQNLKMDSE